MGFFSRRPRPVDANTTTATGTDPTTSHRKPVGEKVTGTHRAKPTHRDDASHTYSNRRPTFGSWIKGTWLDLLTMACMGAIGLGVYNANPAPSRSFPVTFQDGEIVYPEFAYPMRNEIVPIWAAAMMASLIPILVFLIMQIRVRSFWDVNNAVIGLLYSLITAAVFQVFIKWLIGGLRPHFYAVCKPDITRAAALSGGVFPNGFRQIMFDRSICTGDKNEINDALESMPSGHSTAAFAGFMFLYLYLNAKLKVWSNYHPAMWKLIVTYMPVLGACLIAGALTIDEFHNWYDLVAGATIGTIFAFSAYRMTYASVWDFRVNHIPLARNVPFTYSHDHFGFHDSMFTRKAGWGHDGGMSGAPFDQTASMGGLGGSGTHNGTHGGGLFGGSTNGHHNTGSLGHNGIHNGTHNGTHNVV